MVILTAGVEELIVTVLETALVMKIVPWPLSGGTANDQRLDSCQKPAAAWFVQLLTAAASGALSAIPI